MPKFKRIFDFFLVLIISIPSFLSLLNNSYFSMHDDQHIARLFLLDKGISQGYLYPRWVDILGFNFGYPLFNFYPPLVYYLSEIFHKLGFSLIWSVKVTFIAGFIIGAYGMFLLAKKFTNKFFGLFATALYTYFFYHGVLIYVRGALAEFFSLSILPYLFLNIDNLKDRQNLKNTLLLSLTIALLVLIHPLIAFPTIIYILIFLLFYLLSQMFEHLGQIGSFAVSGLLGLMLSAFYWLPSLVERKYTLVNNILTKELASYKEHFICFNQFLFSNWGYGGSIPGCSDGMTFQIGKSHLIAIVISIIGFILYLFSRKTNKKDINYYLFFLFISLFSLFMTTNYSLFIWKNISYLSYLQFPWRFLTFASLFISLTSIYGIYLFFTSLERIKNLKIIISVFVIVYSAMTIYFVGRYFVPQSYLNKSDKELTSFEEVAWRVSRSTFEFAPLGIKTTKSSLNTTIPNIRMIDIPALPYEIIDGKAQVNSLANKFMQKEYIIKSDNAIIFRQNTFNFPGWKAFLNNKEVKINDSNDFKLITVYVPKGVNNLKFAFKDTIVRKIGNYLSLTSAGFIFLFFLFLKFKKIK